MKVMAWTKVKTAVVVGVAVIVAASTTGVMIQTHHHNYKNPIAESSWRNAGYATPEDALQTALWGMSKGDIKTLHVSYTAEFRNEFLQTAGKGKSEAEILALFKQIAGKIASFQVESEEQTADGKLLLHIHCGAGDAVQLLRKVGTEWKLDGNLVAGKQTQAGDIRQ